MGGTSDGLGGGGDVQMGKTALRKGGDKKTEKKSKKGPYAGGGRGGKRGSFTSVEECRKRAQCSRVVRS